jgi:hypothetical protein
MSKVALSGNASGTGTFTIASPNSNTDRTLTLPDNTGTILTTATPGVPVNGPAFSAYSSVNQSFSSSVFTKITLPVEEFDTNSCYDTALSRFTPTVAGYYEVTVSISMSSNVSQVNTVMFKNGGGAKGGFNVTTTATSIGAQVTATVYMNGSTDYLEAYIYAIGTSPVLAAGAQYTFFQAFLARSAT